MMMMIIIIIMCRNALGYVRDQWQYKALWIETPVLYTCLHYIGVVEVVAVSRRNEWSCKVLHCLLCFFVLRFQAAFQYVIMLCLSQWVLMMNPHFLGCYMRYMTIYDLAVLLCAVYWLCRHPEMSRNVDRKQQRYCFVIFEAENCSVNLAKAFNRNTASLKAHTQLFSFFCYSASELVGYVSVI
jgi:hypothetical protein